MKIEKVLETVYVSDFNTTAQILENRIVVKLFNNLYMDKTQCFEYINEYCQGWVQSSEIYHECKSKNKECGIKSDPLLPYNQLYDNLHIYAKDKLGNVFNRQLS